MELREIKSKQNSLRQNIIDEVNRYLGYAAADDVHNDYIYINENTFEVGFRSRHDDRRRDDCEYYSVLSLIKQSKVSWFDPDENAIEAIVQEHIPSPNIKAKVDEWIENIKNFLISDKPEKLHSCRLSIGTSSYTLSCFNEETEPISDGTVLTYEEEMEDEWETVDIEPMRKVASKSGDNVTIRIYDLTKLILNYIKPD